jgi:hypothetical protein
MTASLRPTEPRTSTRPIAYIWLLPVGLALWGAISIGSDFFKVGDVAYHTSRPIAFAGLMLCLAGIGIAEFMETRSR